MTMESSSLLVINVSPLAEKSSALIRSVFSWKTRALRNVFTTASVSFNPSTLLLFDVEFDGDVVGFTIVAIS